MKGKRRVKRGLLTAGMLLLALLGAGYTYLNTGYSADEFALAALEPVEGIAVTMPAEDLVIFAAEEPRAGLIFYPGGKVEHLAYAPLLRELAREGITCVLTEMPFDLAVLDMDAAEKARDQVPEIDRWYIGGHSLGGAMAASYAAEHAADYEGLILLAAYATNDLNNSGLKVISLYGSEDAVLDMEKYREYRANLPENTAEAVLEGGNHAGFGSYGPQEGDGIAAVTAEEQVAWAVEIISCKIDEI